MLRRSLNQDNEMTVFENVFFSHYANVCFSMTLLEPADCGLFHPQGVGKGKQMAKSMEAGSERNVFTQKHNITRSSGLIVFCVRTTGS